MLCYKDMSCCSASYKEAEKHVEEDINFYRSLQKEWRIWQNKKL